MEKKKYNITVGNETKEFEEGTTYQAVAKEFAVVFFILPFFAEGKEKTDCRN